MSDPVRVTGERQNRLSLWAQIKSLGGPDGLAPEQLRLLGMYGGAQGIWVDKQRTSALAPDGVTVGVLHTGTSYADDLFEGGMVYHYPLTRRGQNRDAGEVAATKAASELRLPIFVVIKPTRSARTRNVRLAWVEDWDDTARVFEITFAESPPPISGGGSTPLDDGAPFDLEGKEDGKQSVAQVVREGQHRFKFQVLRRYEGKCVACDLSAPQLLDAAHIRGRRDRGSNDERNGLLLCATHHRAFDSGLLGIRPGSMEFVPARRGPTLASMGVTHTSLDHLARKPHPTAVEWRWTWWVRKNRGDDTPRPESSKA